METPTVSEAAEPVHDRRQLPPLSIDTISGVVLDAKDLDATHAFYSVIFRDRPGEWEKTTRRLTFRTHGQRVEFTRRSRPRTIAHAGQHCAYRVETDRLRAIAEELSAAGHPVNWWREDHPAEREVTAYLSDPSGHTVQLVGSKETGQLIDHYYVPVEDIEHGELFYLKGIRGELQTYFGYTTKDVLDAEKWAQGEDPCAPWTRNAYVSFRTHKPNPTPAAQVFARFGNAYVGITLTGQRLPEPPEEHLKATPRAVLHTSQTPSEVAAYLGSVRISPVALKYDGGRVRFRREGTTIYVRDRSGNFFEIQCDG